MKDKLTSKIQALEMEDLEVPLRQFLIIRVSVKFGTCGKPAGVLPVHRVSSKKLEKFIIFYVEVHLWVQLGKWKTPLGILEGALVCEQT